MNAFHPANNGPLSTGSPTNGSLSNGTLSGNAASRSGTSNPGASGSGASSRSPLDPYAPIEKRSLFTGDGMKSRGYTVRLADQSAASGWRECGVVSDNYLLVPNADVRDMLHEIVDRTGMRFTHDRTVFDGKRFAYALVARDQHLVEVKPGDAVALGVMARNSYDGSERLAVTAYVHRLVCRNGMLSSSVFSRVALKHERRNADWEGEVVRVLSALRHAELGVQRFADAARSLSDARVTAGRLRDLRSGPLQKIPVTLWGKTIDRLLLNEEHSLWGLMNAITELTWHGERVTASDLAHNEAAVNALVEHALSGRLN